MSLNTMAKRLALEIPGVSEIQAKIYLNEALGLIEDSQMWSFQLKEDGWLTPGLLFPSGPGNSVGTVTATPFSNLITGDQVASDAWSAYFTSAARPLLTELQFRSPFYSLYNIIGFNNAGGGGYGVGGYGEGGYGEGTGFSALTLDRPWMEPGGTNLAYMIYQAYFPVPVPDFKRFLTARDTTNNDPMDYWTYTQRDLAVIDPQRTNFSDSNYFVPYQQDQRPGSSTLGSMMYELWPHQLSVLPYSFSYLRRGPQLVNPSDVVPYPLTEELVLWRAKQVAYAYKEAQKGENVERGSGADYKFLIGEAKEELKTVMKPIKDKDRDLWDAYFVRMYPEFFNNGEPYSTQDGQLNIGRM
jgi:hypothetical protein